jgi:serine/threonine-protein kinase
MSTEPQKLGKYEIHRKLGQGGMGVVYAGYDPQIERRVALKTINSAGPNQTWVKDLLRRLKREAQAAGRLQHPNIVSVYEFGEEMQRGEDGKETCLSFIAMEFVDGRELKSDLEASKSFSIAEIVKIMGQLLDALGYSHVNGVVHRDIKPANILLMADGQVKVADFGIARIESSTLTQAGTTMGTPTYMAPEQFNRAETVDERADIYSAGVVLYELLTGEVPFDGSTPAALQHRVLNERPSPPSALNPDVPKAFDAVVQRALAKLPADRFASALELKQAIQAAAGNSQAPTVAVVTTTPFFARPTVRWASVLGFALAVIGGGGFAAYSLLDSGSSLDGDLEPPVVTRVEPKVPPRDAPLADPKTDSPRLIPAVARDSALSPGTLLISSVGLVDSWSPQMGADKGQMEDLVRADARRRLMTKAAALYVEPESLNQHAGVVTKQLMARTGELIKTVFEEGQHQGADGRPLADLRAAVKVREVQKLLNDISKKERIELVRNSGKPKIAVVVRSSGADGSSELQRSVQAENILKAQLQSYGFAIFSNEVPDSALDFRVDGEVKFKKLSARLPESGITIEKFTLTSWTVRAVDVGTKEEIYVNTEVPTKQSWATEEQALQEIGKLLAAAFPRNFFLQYYDFKPQRIQWQFRGVPDDAITALLFEMKGMVQVLDVIKVERKPDGAVIDTEMSGTSDADSALIAESLLQPLNRKLGQRCFGYAGSDNAQIRIELQASCASGKTLERLASATPTMS